MRTPARRPRFAWHPLGDVELTSARGVRRMPVDEFILGALTTSRESDEMVTALYWPAAIPGVRVAFEEISERHGDFAIVAAAAWVAPSDSGWRYGFGLGGVEDRPLALRGTVSLAANSVDEILKCSTLISRRFAIVVRQPTIDGISPSIWASTSCELCLAARRHETGQAGRKGAG